MPLALPLRGRLWAAAAGRREVGGTPVQLALPQRFERPQCLETGCSNEYLALRESVDSAELEGLLHRRVVQAAEPNTIWTTAPVGVLPHALQLPAGWLL
jgi:hypothetical protein